MKYQAKVITEDGNEWVEGFSYRPSESGQWDNGFVPAHPEFGLEWAEKEAYARAKEIACSILDGESGDLKFEVMIEREDMPKEDLDEDLYVFLSSNRQISKLSKV